MCRQCDYPQLLEGAGLDPTSNRTMVLEIIGNSPSPLTPQDILTTLQRNHSINRVTLYRILDLLVEKRLIERIS
ncbi:MAG: Fur family transcriptional regulator, partial [Acidobacteriota bacterium]